MPELSNNAMQLLVSVGRALDKFLTVIGFSIQFVIFFCAVAILLVALEWLFYIGALVWLAISLVVGAFLLLWYVWKRLKMTLCLTVDNKIPASCILGASGGGV